MTPNPIAKVNRQLVTGMVLIAVAWTLSWLPKFTGDPEQLRTHILFFPLWTGYALVVDYWVFRRKGTSLLRRNGRAYIGLFLISAPAWWFFEWLNTFTHNWEYLSKSSFSDLEYAVLASFSFSTVIPAVFGTAELVGTFGWMKRFPPGPRVSPTRRVLILHLILGIGMFIGIVLLPRYFFPCLWLSPYFILAFINARLGHRSLLDYTATGNWRPLVALALGALICGFFWEMWNYYSYPKWIYHVPLVGVGHIFEMPFLGYGGYFPFGLELFAMYHLVVGLIGKKSTLNQYIELE